MHKFTAVVLLYLKYIVGLKRNELFYSLVPLKNKKKICWVKKPMVLHHQVFAKNQLHTLSVFISFFFTVFHSTSLEITKSQSLSRSLLLSLLILLLLLLLLLLTPLPDNCRDVDDVAGANTACCDDKDVVVVVKDGVNSFIILLKLLSAAAIMLLLAIKMFSSIISLSEE